MNAKKLIAVAVLAATALGSGAAHAGDDVPICCILGYWEMGPSGPYWLPTRCF